MRNAVDAVIYDVITALRSANRNEEGLGRVVKPLFVVAQLVPSGKESRIALPGEWGGMHFNPAIEAAFQDAAGIWWVRVGPRGLCRRESPGVCGSPKFSLPRRPEMNGIGSFGTTCQLAANSRGY